MGKATLYSPLKHFLKILFPPQCLHCRSVHEKLATPLCETCASHLDARPAHGHLLITFASIGPAQSLMRELKKHASPQIASLLSAYMALQYSQSSLPLPDLITAVPTSRFRKWQIGDDITAALAQGLGSILDRPFVPLLQRKRQLLRQDLLTKEERLKLPLADFQWKKPHSLRGKTILLIDDTVTTGTTLKRCAERLWEESPAQIIKMGCLDQGYLRE